jgi:GNAT superfamily N-acetyltransferase
VIVRPGLIADLSAIADIERSASRLFVGTHMEWAVGEVTPAEDLLSAITRDDLWVAEADGAAAGFLLAEPLGGDFYIHELAVGFGFQRRGVGAALINAALQAARTRGYRAATLTTDRDLPWNAPYYRRLGFGMLAAADMPPALAARLASQPSPERRCAMRRAL